MRPFEEECDTLDASVFTGDALVLKSNRELLEGLCESWLRRVKEMEDTFAEPTVIPCPYCPEGNGMQCYYNQSCPGCIERMGK